MSRQRVLVLLSAVPIVLGSISLSNWARVDPHAHARRNQVLSHVSPDRMYSTGSTVAAPSSADWGALAEATDRIAQRWRGLLGDGFQFQQRPPFVLAGNVTDEQLAQWYESTIAPAAASMARDYLETLPHRAIVVLLLRDESSYRACVKEHFGQTNVSVYGFYKPARRTLVVNLAAGAGTIVHELTHALVDFDFPEMPLWFNEGLASCHEQCQLLMTDVGPVIAPLPNWRLPILKQAIIDRSLPSVRDLMQTTEMHGADEAVKYAQARYFCMFLHQRGVLVDFYRAFRTRVADDATGMTTLAEFFPDTDWQTLDGQFQRWAMSVRM